MQITRCRVCEGPNLERFLDLGETPPANRFLRPGQLQEPEPFYPLRVLLCHDCGLVQLDEDLPRESVFGDYVYVTGTSDLVHRHAAWLAETLCTRYVLGPDDLVLEAASNDGSVLRAFQWQGVRALGVEPCEPIAALAREQGVETVTAYWDERAAEQVRRERGPVRLFLARHVLAHVTDLHGFVRGIRHVLAPDGVAVLEMPHLANLVRDLQFDTIYHEHLCYFSLRVLQTLFARFGLAVVDACLVHIHGGSLLVHVAHHGHPAGPSPRLAGILEREDALRLAQPRTWQRFADRVALLKEELLDFLDRLRGQGLRLAGYGAPAKGNTLLNYCGIGVDRLPYLVDKSPFKRGLLTPGRHLPVFGVEKLLEDQPDVTLLLAWNFVDEILVQQRAYQNRGGRFAVPLPVVKLIGSQPHAAAVP